MKRWLALLLCAWAGSVAAQWNELTFVDPRLTWRTLETANFAVHFPEQHRSQARLVAGVAESVLPRHTALLRWKPQSRIHIVVLDSADFANGLASPVPFNYSMIFLSPPDEGELLQNREWLELVLTHELFHIVHLDMARTDVLGLRTVFGRLPFLFPNVLQPTWIVEGLAVHAESDPARGYGRLGHSHFEGQMRAEANRGLRSLAELNADGRGFPLNRNYLYGGYFFLFLQERYGPKAVVDFIESYSDNLIPFRVHSNPVTVTGKHMDSLWAEYDDWLRSRFKSSSTPQEGEVLERGWSITGPTLTPDRTRWYLRHDGYTRPQLVRQPPGGTAKAVRDVELDARLAAAPDGSVVLAQPDICRNYNYYYDLYRIAPDGSGKRLSDCTRSRFAMPLDDGRTLTVRVDGGRAQVMTLEGEVLYRAAAGEAVTGIAAKGSRVLLTTLRDGQGRLLEISAGKNEVLLSDAALKHSPRIGDREDVFFVADYGKVFNVWSLRNGLLARWTLAAHGVREISAPRDGEMLLTTIEADGDALRSLRLAAAPLESRAAPAPEQGRAQEIAPLEAADRPYSAWSSLLPRSWLPLLELADGATKLGFITFGQDALGLHQYTVAPAYEFSQGEMLGSLSYLYDQRHELLVDRAMTVKGTTPDDKIAAFNIEESVHWVSTWRHLMLNRRFYWGLGGALERERLHRVNGPTASAQDERVLGLVAGIDTRRIFWLSEGHSQGFQLRLFAETSRGLHGTFSGDVYRADTRLHFPLGKTVLSLRWNEAWGEADAEPFQLGGSETDPPAFLPIINQRDFPLRGYTSGEPSLTGNRARLGSVEWRVPLRDVDRHAMVPPIGLNRLALNLFFDVGAAWGSGAEPDYHRGFGFEVMGEVRLGYLFPAEVRLGLADGRDQGGKTTAYLRIGRSF